MRFNQSNADLIGNESDAFTFSSFSTQILRQPLPSLALAACEPPAETKRSSLKSLSWRSFMVFVTTQNNNLMKSVRLQLRPPTHLNPGVPWMASRLEVKQHAASPSQRCWTRNPSDQQSDYTCIILMVILQSEN